MKDKNIAYMLLELSKQSDDSNEEVKTLDFVNVYQIDEYINARNRNDSEVIYSVYADSINDNNDEMTATFYFSVSYSRYYKQKFDNIDVVYLYATSIH